MCRKLFFYFFLVWVLALASKNVVFGTFVIVSPLASSNNDVEKEVVCGDMDFAGIDPELMYDKTGGTAIEEQAVGIRFRDIRIPKGSTILSAYVQLTSDEHNVWSFMKITPKTAYDPVPADGAISVDTHVILSWTPGLGAKLHYVYFGDNFDDVKNASVGLPQSTATYNPGPLERGKTYYWRVDEFGVDEFGSFETHKGDVWSFRTKPFIPITDPSLVGWWKLDEGSGTRAYDSSGHGNHGTIVGNPTWIAHVGGTALEFHGLGVPGGGGDYIDCGNDDTLDITGPISIALWIRPGADDPEGKGTETAPMAKADQSMSPSWSWQVRYGWGGSSPQPYMAFTFNSSPRAWAYVGRNLERDEWCHIACSHDGTTLKCYLNGEQTDSTPMTEIASSNTPLLIGSDGWGCDWIGAIDDVRLYEHALSVPEIMGVYEGGMAPTPNVYYIDADATGKNDGSNWVDAYVYLQDALTDANDAQKPVEIRMAQGTYTPDCGNGYVRGDKQAKFLLKSGVTIKGGFAGVGADDPNAWDHQAYETVLSGDLSGNDERLLANFVENSDHVIWCIEGDASAVLDGFTITGGYATDRIGGGLLNYKANPTVKRCVFFDNYASQGGGMANRYSSPTVTDCTFDGNLAPYGGGGMYNTDQSHPMVESCVFHDNWTTYLGGGGMYCGDSNPTVIHCLFVDNVAPFGGGMYNAAANPFIGNCTFSNNRSNSWGGGMQNEAGAKPTVTNCILWGDIPDEIAFSGSANVTYSDVEGGWAGIGNIARDPKFADAEGRLSSGSPCIDAGNNEAVHSSITTDLDGNPRIINGTVDMGAYEFGGTTPPPPPVTNALSEALDTSLSFATGGSADWFSQTAMSYYGGDAAQSGGISDEQESWMQTTVSGKGTLKFYWMVSSEQDYDFLEFYIDGSLEDQISGLVDDWEQMTYTISTSGSHVLEWRYMKDSVTDEGSDCGWVDKVEWVTTP